MVVSLNVCCTRPSDWIDRKCMCCDGALYSGACCVWNVSWGRCCQLECVMYISMQFNYLQVHVLSAATAAAASPCWVLSVQQQQQQQQQQPQPHHLPSTHLSHPLTHPYPATYPTLYPNLIPPPSNFQNALSMAGQGVVECSSHTA